MFVFSLLLLLAVSQVAYLRVFFSPYFTRSCYGVSLHIMVGVTDENVFALLLLKPDDCVAYTDCCCFYSLFVLCCCC